MAKNFKTGVARITMVAVFCPDCGEAFYDEDDHDWSAASPRLTGAYRPGRQVRCTACGLDFHMPAVMARIGHRK